MFYPNHIYKKDLEESEKSVDDIKKIKNSSFFITGASGLIGSFLTDVLMYCNEELNYNIQIYASGRNKERLVKRFKSHILSDHFHIIEYDVNKTFCKNIYFDYIIHAASNAFPNAFSKDPVGTIMGNVLGAYNLLQYAKENNVKRLLYISSGEVYGEAEPGLQSFSENFSGYVDCTNSRSCYPTSKRAAENLCISFTKQFGVDTVIARPCHTYGPTTTSSDNRVSNQFVNNVINNEDIVLKSKGEQIRSYNYISDCVSGILTILINGESGSAYNVSNKNAVISIADMAKVVAGISGKKVIFDLPDDVEKTGYSTISRGVLNQDRLDSLGWKGHYDIERGFKHTIDILKSFSK